MADSRILLTAAVLLMSAGTVAGRDYPVAVTAARVGLPQFSPGGESTGTLSRFGAWAPVYVELELARPVNGPAELVIETADPDEIGTTLAVPLNLAGASGKVSAAALGTIGYVRPAGVGEVTITVREAGGGEALSEPFRLRSLRPRDPLSYVVLSIGSQPAGFDLPRPATGGQDQPGLRGGRVELTAILDIANLPDRWIGYDAVDAAILHTGNGELLEQLLSPAATSINRRKRLALLEWVRRGGRLVIATGTNASAINNWPDLKEMLPYEVAGNRPTGPMAILWLSRESTPLNAALIPKSGSFPLAILAPKSGRAARMLIPFDRRDDSAPLIAGQSSYGLGRVTLVGFDLDRAPFADMEPEPRARFWDWVLREGGSTRASYGSEGRPRPVSTSVTEEEDELAVALRTHSDTFDNVPVISFGWVAFLIVLYIILIGPLEYYFLKRILGRLELTWITFPIIVLTVCIAAYLTAFSMKGRELKVNKVDVIDIDPASGRIYGTTLFTIFSPRIDNYTLAVTPGEGWSNDADEPAGTALSWVGAPRGGKASLLRRGYQYHTDESSVADGLVNVPVQVWSTKSFVANWSAKIDPAMFDHPSPGERIRHPLADPVAVFGAFQNRLPAPALTDCVIFYAGQAYPLPGGTIHAGDIVRLVLDQPLPAGDWLRKESKLETDLLMRAPVYRDRAGSTKAVGPQAPQQGAVAATATGGPLPMLGVLFHEASLSYGEGKYPTNASLRRLDQSWRLHPDNRGEVILVGRAALPSGPAEKTLSGPESPSRLWLKGLPGDGANRAPITGTGRQETWVRIFLPVK